MNKHMMVLVLLLTSAGVALGFGAEAIAEAQPAATHVIHIKK